MENKSVSLLVLPLKKALHTWDIPFSSGKPVDGNCTNRVRYNACVAFSRVAIRN